MQYLSFLIEYREHSDCRLAVDAFIVSEINLGLTVKTIMYSLKPTTIYFINTSALYFCSSCEIILL